MIEFYTYLWLRKDGTPYYIGKGKGKRAFTSRDHTINRPKDDARIFVQRWESEQKAFEMEKWYISLFGRKDNRTGILRNRTDGGDCGPNLKGRKIHSEKWKQTMRESVSRMNTPEANAKKAAANRRRKFTTENRKRMSESAKKHRLTLSPEQRKASTAAASAACRGVLGNKMSPAD